MERRSDNAFALQVRIAPLSACSSLNTGRTKFFSGSLDIAICVAATVTNRGIVPTAKEVLHRQRLHNLNNFKVETFSV